MKEFKYEVFGRPIVGLSGIERFSRRLKNRTENVAEHSWYVSYFTMKICKDLGINDEISLLALKYAVCHDIPEIALDDVNHDVKTKFPMIKMALEEEEEKLFKELDSDVWKSYISVSGKLKNNYPGLNYAIAHAIVDLADVHSVMCYIESEARLGNDYFENIKQETEERILEYENYLMNLLEVLT